MKPVSTTVDWIDAREKKPPVNRVVLVEGGVAIWTRDPLTGEGRWRSITGFEWPGSLIQWEVTHWADLPEPPRTRGR